MPAHRLQFSLRFLLAAMSLACVAMGLGWTYHRVGQRDQLRKALIARGAILGSAGTEPAGGVPLLWKCFGARSVGLIALPEYDYSSGEIAQIAALFPESTIRRHAYIDDSKRPVGRVR